MTAHDAMPGYLRMTEGTDWHNELHTTPVMGLARYRPVRSAKRVACPLLVCAAADDTVTPPAGAVRAARAALRGELRLYPFGHFDVYYGDGQEQAIADQIAFLDRTLATRT